MPAPHPPEFSRRAIDLARLPGASVAQVAKDLGTSESGLRRWLSQDDIDVARRACRPASSPRHHRDCHRWDRHFSRRHRRWHRHRQGRRRRCARQDDRDDHPAVTGLRRRMVVDRQAGLGIQVLNRATCTHGHWQEQAVLSV